MTGSGANVIILTLFTVIVHNVSILKAKNKNNILLCMKFLHKIEAGATHIHWCGVGVGRFCWENFEENLLLKYPSKICSKFEEDTYIISKDMHNLHTWLFLRLEYYNICLHIIQFLFRLLLNLSSYRDSDTIILCLMEKYQVAIHFATNLKKIHALEP